MRDFSQWFEQTISLIGKFAKRREWQEFIQYLTLHSGAYHKANFHWALLKGFAEVSSLYGEEEEEEAKDKNEDEENENQALEEVVDFKEEEEEERETFVTKVVPPLVEIQRSPL